MALGTVIRSFAAPAGNSPMCLDWFGVHLWHTNQQAQRIYQVDPVSGVLIRQIVPPGASPSGVAFDGVHLWHTNYTAPATLYQLDMAGTVLRSTAITNLARGIAWDGRSIWGVTENTGAVTQYDPVSLAQRSAFSLGVAGVTGIAFDGTHFWTSSNNTNLIYKVDMAGTILTSFAPPSTLASGLAWDGRTLWHSDYNTDRIYQLMVN